MPQVQGFLKAIAEIEEKQLKLNSVSTRAANLDENEFKNFLKE